MTDQPHPPSLSDAHDEARVEAAPDYPAIFLSCPKHQDAEYGRTWCRDDNGPCHCGREWSKYVRSDLADAAAHAVSPWRPPDGWKLVPVEPTETMIEAFYDGAEDARDEHLERRHQLNEQRSAAGKKPFPFGIAPVEWFSPAYRAMLAAAPSPPVQTTGEPT